MVKLTDDWSLETKDAGTEVSSERLKSSLDALRPSLDSLSVPPAGPPATPSPLPGATPPSLEAPDTDATSRLALSLDALRPTLDGLSVPPAGPPATPATPSAPYRLDTGAAFQRAKGAIGSPTFNVPNPTYKSTYDFQPPDQGMSVPPSPMAEAPAIGGLQDTLGGWVASAGSAMASLGTSPTVKAGDRLGAEAMVNPWLQAQVPGGYVVPAGMQAGALLQPTGAALEYGGRNVRYGQGRNAPETNLRDEWRARGMDDTSIIIGENFGRSVVAPLINAPQGALDTASDVGFWVTEASRNANRGEWGKAAGNLVEGVMSFGDFADNAGLLIPGVNLSMMAINAIGATAGSLFEVGALANGASERDARRIGAIANSTAQALFIVREFVQTVRSFRRLGREAAPLVAREAELEALLNRLGIRSADPSRASVGEALLRATQDELRQQGVVVDSLDAVVQRVGVVAERERLRQKVSGNADLLRSIRSERRWQGAEIGATATGAAMGAYEAYQDMLDRGIDPSNASGLDWLEVLGKAADQADSVQSLVEGAQVASAAGRGVLRGARLANAFRQAYARQLSGQSSTTLTAGEDGGENYQAIPGAGTYDLSNRNAMTQTQPEYEAVSAAFEDLIQTNPNATMQAFQTAVQAMLPEDNTSLPIGLTPLTDKAGNTLPMRSNVLTVEQAQALTDPNIGTASDTGWRTEQVDVKDLPQLQLLVTGPALALVAGDLDVTIGGDGQRVVRQSNGTQYLEAMRQAGRRPTDIQPGKLLDGVPGEPDLVDVPPDAKAYRGAFGTYRVEWQEGDTTRQVFLTTNGAIGSSRMFRQGANRTAKAPASMSVYDPNMHTDPGTVTVTQIAPGQAVDDLRQGDYVVTQWVAGDTVPGSDVDPSASGASLVSSDRTVMAGEAINTSAGATSYRLPSGAEAIVSNTWTPQRNKFGGRMRPGYARTVWIRSRQAPNPYQLNRLMFQDYRDYGTQGETLQNWYPLMGQVFAAIANGVDLRTGQRIDGWNASPRLKLALTKMLGAVWGETTSQTSPDNNLRKTLVILGVSMDYARARQAWFEQLDPQVQQMLTAGGFQADRMPTAGEVGEMLSEGRLTVRLQRRPDGSFYEAPGTAEKVKGEGDKAVWRGVEVPGVPGYAEVDPNRDWTVIDGPVAGEVDDAGQPIIDPATGEQRTNNLWKVSTWVPRGIAPTQPADGQRKGSFGNFKPVEEVAGTLDTLAKAMRVVESNFKSTQFTFQSVLAALNGYVPGSVIDVHAYSGAGFDPRTALSGETPTNLKDHIASLQKAIKELDAAGGGNASQRQALEADLQASLRLRSTVSSEGNSGWETSAIRGAGTNPVQQNVEAFWLVETMYREIAREFDLPQDAVQAILWFAAKNEISSGDWGRERLAGPVKLGDGWVDASAGENLLAGSVTQTADVNAPLARQFLEWVRPWIDDAGENWRSATPSVVLDPRVNLPVLHRPSRPPTLDSSGRPIVPNQEPLKVTVLNDEAVIAERNGDTVLAGALREIASIIKKWGRESLQGLMSDDKSAYAFMNQTVRRSPTYRAEAQALEKAVRLVADKGWSRNASTPAQDVEIVSTPKYKTPVEGLLQRVRSQIQRVVLAGRPNTKRKEAPQTYRDRLANTVIKSIGSKLEATLNAETIVDAAQYAALAGPRAVIPVEDGRQALEDLKARGRVRPAPETYGRQTYREDSYQLVLPINRTGRDVAHRLYVDGNGQLIVEGSWNGYTDNALSLASGVLAPLADALGIDPSTPVTVSQLLQVDNAPTGVATTGLSLLVELPKTGGATADTLARALQRTLPTDTHAVTVTPDGQKVVVTPLIASSAPSGNAERVALDAIRQVAPKANVSQFPSNVRQVTMGGAPAGASDGDIAVITDGRDDADRPIELRSALADINASRASQSVAESLRALTRNIVAPLADALGFSGADATALADHIDGLQVRLEVGTPTFGNYRRDGDASVLSLNAHAFTDGAMILAQNGTPVDVARDTLAKAMVDTILHELLHHFGFRHDNTNNQFANEDEYNIFLDQVRTTMQAGSGDGSFSAYDIVFSQATRIANTMLARDAIGQEWQRQSTLAAQLSGDAYATQPDVGIDGRTLPLDANARYRSNVALTMASQRQPTVRAGTGQAGIPSGVAGPPAAVSRRRANAVVGATGAGDEELGRGRGRRTGRRNAAAVADAGGLGGAGADGAGAGAPVGGAEGAGDLRGAGAAAIGAGAQPPAGADMGGGLDGNLAQSSTSLAPDRGAYMDRPDVVDPAKVRGGTTVRAVGADESYYVSPATDAQPAVLVGSLSRRATSYDNEYDPTRGRSDQIVPQWQTVAQQIASAPWATRYREDVRNAATYIWDYLISLGLASESGTIKDIGRAYRSTRINDLVVDNVLGAEQRQLDPATGALKVPSYQDTFPGVNRGRDTLFGTARGRQRVAASGASVGSLPTARQAAIATARLLPRQMTRSGANAGTGPENGAFLSRVGPIDDMFILVDSTTLGVAMAGTMGQGLIAPSRMTPWQVSPTPFQPPAFRPAPSAVGLNPFVAYLSAMAFARAFPQLTVPDAVNRGPVTARTNLSTSTQPFSEEHVRSLWSWQQVGTLVHEMVHRLGVVHTGAASRMTYDRIVDGLLTGGPDPYNRNSNMVYERRDRELMTRDVAPSQLGDVGRSMNPVVRLLMRTYDYMVANGFDDSARLVIDQSAARLRNTFMVTASDDDARAVAQSNWISDPQQVSSVTNLPPSMFGFASRDASTLEGRPSSAPAFPAGTYEQPTLGEDDRFGTIGPDGKPQASTSLAKSTITAGFGNAGGARIEALGLEAPPEFAGLYDGKSRREVAKTQFDHLRGIGLMDSRGRLVDFDRLNVPYRIRYGGFGSWADSPETKGGLYSAGYEDNLYIEVPPDVPDDYVRGLAAVAGLSDLQSAMGARRFFVRDPQQATFGMVTVAIPDGEREDPVGWLLREHEGLQPTFSANVPGIDWVVGSAWEADPGGAYAYMIPYEAYGVQNDTPDARSARLDNWSEQVLNTLYGYGVSDRIVQVVDVDVATVGQWGEPYGQAIARLNGLQPLAGGPAGGLRVPATGGRRVGTARERGLGDQAGGRLADVYAPADVQRDAVPAGRSGAPYYTVAWASQRVQDAASYYRRAYGYRTVGGRFRADVTADLSAPDVGIIGGDRASLPQASSTLAGGPNGQYGRAGVGSADASGADRLTITGAGGPPDDRGAWRGGNPPGVRNPGGNQADRGAGFRPGTGVGRGVGSLTQSSTSLPTDDDLRYVAPSRYGMELSDSYLPPEPYIISQDRITGRPAVSYLARQRRLGSLRENLPRDASELAQFADQAAASPTVAQFLAGAKLATDYWSEQFIRLGVLPRSPADWEASARSGAVNDLIRLGAGRSDAGFATLTPEQMANSIGRTVRKQAGGAYPYRSIQPVTNVGINIDPRVVGMSMMGFQAEQLGATARSDVPADPDRPEGFAPAADIIMMNPFFLWAAIDSVDSMERRVGEAPLTHDERRLLWAYAVAGLSGHETLHHAGPIHTLADPDEARFEAVLTSLAPGATDAQRSLSRNNDGVDRNGMPLAPLLRSLARQYDTLESGGMRDLTQQWMQALATEYRRGYNSGRPTAVLQLSEREASTAPADFIGARRSELDRGARSLNVPQSASRSRQALSTLDGDNPMASPDAPGYAEDLLSQASTTLPDVSYLRRKRGDRAKARRVGTESLFSMQLAGTDNSGSGRVGGTGAVPVIATSQTDLGTYLRAQGAVSTRRDALATTISSRPWARSYVDLLARSAEYWSRNLAELRIIPDDPLRWEGFGRLRNVNDIVARNTKLYQGTKRRTNQPYDVAGLATAEALSDTTNSTLSPTDRARMLSEITSLQTRPENMPSGEWGIQPVTEAGILLIPGSLGRALGSSDAWLAGASTSPLLSRQAWAQANVPYGYQPNNAMIALNPMMMGLSLDAVDAWLLDSKSARGRLTHEQRRTIWGLAHAVLVAHEVMHHAGPMHGGGDPGDRLFDEAVQQTIAMPSDRRRSAPSDTWWTDLVDRTPSDTVGQPFAPLVRSWMRLYDEINADDDYRADQLEWFAGGVADAEEGLRRRADTLAQGQDSLGAARALAKADAADFIMRRDAIGGRNYAGGIDEILGTPYDLEQVQATTDDAPLPWGEDDRPSAPRYLQDVQSSSSLPGRMKPGERKRTVDRQGLPLTREGDAWVAALADRLAWEEVPSTAGPGRLTDANGNPITPAQRERIRVSEAGRRLQAREAIKAEIINRFEELWTGGYVATGGVIDPNLAPPPMTGASARQAVGDIVAVDPTFINSVGLIGELGRRGRGRTLIDSGEMASTLGARFVRGITRLRYASMLSGTAGAVNDVIGNALMGSVVEVPRRIVQAGTEAAMERAGIISRRDRIIFADGATKATWAGLTGSFVNAVKAATDFIVEGGEGIRTESPRTLIAGKAGIVPEIGLRSRMAADAFVHTLGLGISTAQVVDREMQRLGLRWGSPEYRGKSHDMRRAIASRLRRTGDDAPKITDNTLEGEIMRGAASMVFQEPFRGVFGIETFRDSAESLFWNLMIPFYRTTANLAVTGFEMTPAVGAIPLAVDLARSYANRGPYAPAREGFSARPSFDPYNPTQPAPELFLTRAQREQGIPSRDPDWNRWTRSSDVRVKPAVHRISLQILGTMYAGVAAGMYAAGMMTGGGPGDEKERKALEKDGWRPFALHIGDQYYEVIKLIGPLALPMMMGAGIAEVVDRYGQYPTTALLQAMATSMGSWLTQNAGLDSLRQAADFVESMWTLDKPNFARSGANTASSFVPYSGLVRQVAKALDPYDREAKTFVEYLMQMTPGLRERLPKQRDELGREFPRDAGMSGLRAMLPLQSTTDVTGKREPYRFQGSRSNFDDAVTSRAKSMFRDWLELPGIAKDPVPDWVRRRAALGEDARYTFQRESEAARQKPSQANDRTTAVAFREPR